MNLKLRNSLGFTLPFALTLTFIFSGLVGVSYMFVSINLRQMQSNLWAAQAATLAEGINERVKARMNTKSKIQLSPNQEDKLKDPSLADDSSEDEDSDEDDEEVEDEFNEQTEDFDEYYADEVLKISRYITFKEPPEKVKKREEGGLVQDGRPQEGRPQDVFNPQGEDVDPEKTKPEANVDKIGNIDVPEGTILNKKTKLVIFKDEKISLKLDDIVNPTPKPYMNQLPVPKIKSLSPNYSEGNKRSSTIIIGENYPKGDPYFNEKGIIVEEIKSGPQFDLLILMSVKPGMKRLFWGSAQAEFYIIPTYDGSEKPNIQKVLTTDGNDLLDINAGKRGQTLRVTGANLFLNKAKPVAIGDVNGVYPRVKDSAQGGNELTVTLDVGRNVEPGVHSIIIATEGGLSNSWLFNVLPPVDREEIRSDSASFSTSLTLLDIMVIDKVLPIINDAADTNMQNDTGRPVDPNQDNQDPADSNNPEEELTEEQKVGKFGNVDLETVWLLETSVMVGNSTKTVSEVVHRELPLINAALLSNSKITFEGGSFPINGATGASTMLVEPTYLSNTNLIVEGPPEEPTEPIAVPDTSPNSAGGPGGRPGQNQQGPKTPSELGFKESSYVAVYKDGDKIRDLDYAIIHMLGRNTIDLLPPGLMDYHYANDTILQFLPPIISKEKLSDDDTQFHTNPQGFSLAKSNAALFKNIFNSNLDQFAEVADLYTNDPSAPLDEYDLPQGYMGLTYIEGTPRYDQTNVLTGKGLLIIDTRPGNLGKPVGDVEFSGDSKSPVDFKGIIYVHGNLKVNGSLNVTGALIVDNESTGDLSFANNANGMITYDYQYIKQAILSIPFTTKPGTVMISSKPIDLSEYAQGGTTTSTETTQTIGDVTDQQQQDTSGMTTAESKTVDLKPEEALIETTQPSNEPSGEKKTAEEELIDLF